MGLRQGSRPARPPVPAARGATATVEPGARFGLLTVIAEAEPYRWRGRITHRAWHCACDCGRNTVARQDALSRGHTRSCGCERGTVAGALRLSHGARAGGHRSREYALWQGLRAAARRDGRALPEEWTGAQGFAAFRNALGPWPGPGHRVALREGASGAVAADWGWAAGPPRRRPRWRVWHGGALLTLRELAEATGTKYATLVKRIRRRGAGAAWPGAGSGLA